MRAGPVTIITPLRKAIDRAVSSDQLRAAVSGHLDFALAEHTYEGHLEHAIDRVADLHGRDWSRVVDSVGRAALVNRHSDSPPA